MKKRFSALLCSLVLLLALAGCTAGETGDRSGEAGSEPEKPEMLVLTGEPGQQYEQGDFLVEVVSRDEVEKAASKDDSVPGSKRWNLMLNGESRSEPGEITKSYPLLAIWIALEETSGDVIFNLTKADPTAAVLEGSCIRLPAGAGVCIRCTRNLEEDLYFANFTCAGGEMAGIAVCRVFTDEK